MTTSYNPQPARASLGSKYARGKIRIRTDDALLERTGALQGPRTFVHRTLALAAVVAKVTIHMQSPAQSKGQRLRSALRTTVRREYSVRASAGQMYAFDAVIQSAVHSRKQKSCQHQSLL